MVNINGSITHDNTQALMNTYGIIMLMVLSWEYWWHNHGIYHIYL